MLKGLPEKVNKFIDERENSDTMYYVFILAITLLVTLVVLLVFLQIQ